MKKYAKVVVAMSSFCAVSGLFASVVMADTTTTTPSQPTQLQSELQTQRADVKNNEVQNKQLSSQIKSALQAWKSANPSPMQSLSAADQTQVKTLRANIKTAHGTVKSDVSNLKSLRAQKKSANAAHDTATVASLTSQIKSLLADIQTQRQTISNDKSQLNTLLPADSVKAFRQKETTFRSVVKPDTTALKTAEQQLKTDEQTRKTDRQNKNWTNVLSDLQVINSDLTTIISAKQKLLADIGTAQTTSSQA